MIDKLELRLPPLTPLSPRVREFILESRHFKNSTRTMSSGRYERVTDIRPVGIDALLHYGLKRKENEPHAGEHKLELLDTSKKSYSGLAMQIEGCFDCAPDDLEIMRIDLCADMDGVPVEWFLNRTRIKFKRVAHEVGLLKYQRVGKAGIQTISAGKRPNIVRIYDKVAEYKDQLQKLQRKRSRDAEELTLMHEFGIAEDATITRVERQFGGGRIPAKIDCFGLLPRLLDFNPFASVEILNGTGSKIPTIPKIGLDAWLTGTRLSQLHREMGEQQFRRWLNANSTGNGARYRKKYEAFLNPELDRTITAQTIFETYRESVAKQLTA